MLFFSKRCTMPCTSSPWRSLNSSKMISRSTSRTRCTIFCLAAWAAIRPNTAASIFMSSSSPSSTSGSSVSRASSRSISMSGSATSSTTTLASKSSISPMSGLYCASKVRSAPNVFLAADTMADSMASTSISLSIPFSLVTCSMTRLRSCCILFPRHQGDAHSYSTLALTMRPNGMNTSRPSCTSTTPSPAAPWRAPRKFLRPSIISPVRTRTR